MKITVDSYKLFGHRDMLREAVNLAPLAARVVEQTIPGRMPPVQITLTTPKGIAELATWAEVALVGDVEPRIRNRALADATRQARKAAGRAVPTPFGGVLILLNARQHRTEGDLALTLVHELTHAVQFSRPGVRDRIVRDLRDDFGIEPQTCRSRREHMRRLGLEEREAYAAERLADQLTGRAALAA